MKKNTVLASGTIGLTPFFLIAILMALMFEASGFTHFISDIQGFIK